MKKINHKLIIIGSGPAGYTAALYAARANLKPLLITGLEKGGQLINTNNIENWPGVKKTITGPSLMKKIHNHVTKFNVKIVSDYIKKVNFKVKPFILYGDNNNYKSHCIIIATGSSPRFLNIKSESFYKGKGISTCATCDGFFYKKKSIAIIGGGNVAIEEALYLSNIAKKIHIIHRRNNFKAEKILIERLQNKKNIIIYFNYYVKEILGNNNTVTNMIIQSMVNKKKIKIKIDGIFIAIGHIPNTDIFKKQLILNNGYIKTKLGCNYNFTQTNIEGIFAAGDVMDQTYKQAITSAASGCMAALDAEKYINKYNLLK